MLDEVTPEMEAAFDAVVDDHVQGALGGYDPKTLDLGALERQVADYVAWLGLDYRSVVAVESPLAMQVAANAILKGTPVDRVGGRVRGRVWDRVWGRVWDRVGGRVGGRVGDRVWDRVGGRVWGRVWDRVRGRVGGRVRGRVRGRVEGRVEGQYVPTEWVGQCNVGWVSFYDLFLRTTDILQADGLDDALRRHISAIKGVWDMLDAGDTLIICPTPHMVKMDAQGNLSSSTGPAIAWPDGHEEHYWRGVSLAGKEWVIEDPGRLSVKEALAEQNAEVRWAMMDLMGTERLAAGMDDAGARRIDESVDPSGGPIALWDIPVEESNIRLIEVRCPSTGKQHFLRVRRDRETARDALAATFGLTAERYYGGMRVEA